MTSYEDTKVQLTINRMTEECYDNIPDKSSTELYLVSQDPTTPAKIDLDAQSKTDAAAGTALSAGAEPLRRKRPSDPGIHAEDTDRETGTEAAGRESGACK